MLDRLEAIKARFDQLGVALTNPAIVGNNKKFTETSKEYRSLEKIVLAYNEYKKILEDIDFYKEALNGDDEEMRELAKMEAPALEERKSQMEAFIRQLLILNGTGCAWNRCLTSCSCSQSCRCANFKLSSMSAFQLPSVILTGWWMLVFWLLRWYLMRL